ncbi:MAG: hypothetical protein NZ739_09085 [Verrucomicrobiae bacterium]|nr:hypothetical protein [Verrucomicrobiae bacterium]
MTNPKHEIRNSKQIRSSKFQMVSGLRGSVLECGLTAACARAAATPVTNPAHGIRNPNQIQSTKLRTNIGLRAGVLECDGLPPLFIGQACTADTRAHLVGCPAFRLSGSHPGRARHGGIPGMDLANCEASAARVPAKRDRCCAPGCSAVKPAQSKRFAFFWALLVPVLCLSLSVFAQYSIDWWTIDGGGGTSTGGLYTVSGTIGQPDAGPVMTGGVYSVQGGFWGVVAAVQTPGAPYLTVARTATNTVVFSWPLADSAGWVLQATTNLVSGGSVWVTIPPPYRTNGPSIEYIESYPVGNKFYRLHKP